MTTIHVAAGLPPGHRDPCTCRPVVFRTADGNEVVIHNIAAPEHLRAIAMGLPEANDVSTRDHHGTRAEEERRAIAQARICARQDCGHTRAFHWGPTNRDEPPESFDFGGGYCTYPGTRVTHCHQFIAGPRDAQTDPGALPDPAPQHG